MKWKLFFLTVVFLSVFSACKQRGRDRMILGPGNPNPGGPVTQEQTQRQTEYKITEKMERVNNGEWIRKNTLTALCATGTVSCSDGSQVACYSGLNDADFYVGNFADIAENSLPVCVQGSTATILRPKCPSKTQPEPVCAIPTSAQNTTMEIEVACDYKTDSSSIICPFGGRPVCINDVEHVLEGPYCINNQNFLISDTPGYGDLLSLYTISCADKKHKPSCD